jgi:hypothetical protein
MPRQRFFYGPPFRFIAERLLQEEGLRAGLKQIVSLPDLEFSSLAAALDAHPNFLTTADVTEIVQKHVSSEVSEGLTRTLLRLNSAIRNAQEPEDEADEALEVLCAAIAKFPADFPRDSVEVLKVRLRGLVLAPRGFKRQKKAETLAEATGADLNELNIICDIRPVFDDARKEIDGALVIATLTLEILELDGRSSSVECRLTEKQLDDLYKVSVLAKQKLVAIKTLLNAKSIPWARVFETTRTEE